MIGPILNIGYGATEDFGSNNLPRSVPGFIADLTTVGFVTGPNKTIPHRRALTQRIVSLRWINSPVPMSKRPLTLPRWPRQRLPWGKVHHSPGDNFRLFSYVYGDLFHPRRFNPSLHDTDAALGGTFGSIHHKSAWRGREELFLTGERQFGECGLN